MAATLSPATLPAAAALGCGLNCSMRRRTNLVVCIGELSSFGGLKAHNSIASLGLPACADRSFAGVLSALKSPPQGRKGRRGGGGALSSTCNAAAEIFKIAAIMNALVMVGVAVGFVILRIEATLEEAE